MGNIRKYFNKKVVINKSENKNPDVKIHLLLFFICECFKNVIKSKKITLSLS